MNKSFKELGFKPGDKIRCTYSTTQFCYKVGDILTIKEDFRGEDFNGEFGWSGRFGKWEKVEEMKYENKWILNEGQEIPLEADCLKKDGLVVAYRLPVEVIEVGDFITAIGRPNEYKVLYIHNEDPSRKYIVYAYKGDIPKSSEIKNVKLSRKGNK